MVVSSIAQAFDSATDAPDTHAPGAEPARIAALLRQLQQQVHENDTAAGDTLDALKSLLADDARIERIARHLSKYDFNAACADVDALADTRGAFVTETPQKASAGADLT